MQKSAETQIEYLECNLAEVRTEMALLQNKPWGASISEQMSKLPTQEQRMTAELNELRPYSIAPMGDGFVIAHKGMFVLDETGRNWLEFETEIKAQIWIEAKLNRRSQKSLAPELPIAAE